MPYAVPVPLQAASVDHWLQALIKRKAMLERLQVPPERSLTLLATTMLWIESMHKVSL